MNYRTVLLGLVACAVLMGCGESAEVTSTPEALPTGTESAGNAAEAAASTSSGAVFFKKGSQAPSIKAFDIRGHEVDLDKIIDAGPDLVIEFLFQVSGGKEIARRLGALDRVYKDEIQIIALGLREDESALKAFANDLNIVYFIIDTESMENAEWLEEVQILPLTLFIHPNDERKIVNVLQGTSELRAKLITKVAQNFFLDREKGAEEAGKILDIAKELGEDEKGMGELSGYILTAQGKLDEAEAAFGAIDSKTGLAKVALERGDFETAIATASEAGPNSGYADTVRATALQRQGKLEEAAAAFESAAGKPGEDWQTSEAVNGKARILHQQGQTDAAIAAYRAAVDLSPYNVTALSNEAAALRESGDLEGAQTALERAQKWGGSKDDLIVLAYQQNARELERANDLKRLEMIGQQVKDLGARFRELKKAGKAEPVDPWSTRPQVLAFLPSSASQSVFFERAGMDIVIRREIEARLGADGRVRVVEREVLELLLQELDLGTSDIADKDTQLQLGKVLSARMLGFLDFASIGPDNVLYVRLADTQTTELTNLTPKTIRNDANIGDMVQTVVDEILAKVVEGKRLKGLIADASSDDAIIINLGSDHGAKVGQRFMVVKDGDPIKAGGRVVRYQQVKIATIEITEVEQGSSTCKLVSEKDVKLKSEMKILAEQKQ